MGTDLIYDEWDYTKDNDTKDDSREMDLETARMHQEPLSLQPDLHGNTIPFPIDITDQTFQRYVRNSFLDAFYIPRDIFEAAKPISGKETSFQINRQPLFITRTPQFLIDRHMGRGSSRSPLIFITDWDTAFSRLSISMSAYTKYISDEVFTTLKLHSRYRSYITYDEFAERMHLKLEYFHKYKVRIPEVTTMVVEYNGQLRIQTTTPRQAVGATKRSHGKKQTTNKR